MVRVSTNDEAALWAAGTDVPAAQRAEKLASNQGAANNSQPKPANDNVPVVKDATGDIPGIDRPFRPTNPDYPPNSAVVEKMNSLQICGGTDCSEIASVLQKTAGSGRVLTVTGQSGSDLQLLENGKIDTGFKYHEVLADGKYGCDPRLSNAAVPLCD